MLELLVKKGIDINVKHETGKGFKMNPLELCIVNNNLECVEKCIELGSNIHNGKGLLPIHLAIIYNRPLILKYLIVVAKANVEERVNDEGSNFHGFTPLLLASIEGNMQLVHILLTEGKADVNVLSYKGESPVTMAARSGNFNLLKMFIANGAKI